MVGSRPILGVRLSCSGAMTQSNHDSGSEGFISTAIFPPNARRAASIGQCVAWPAPSIKSGFGNFCPAGKRPASQLKAYGQPWVTGTVSIRHSVKRTNASASPSDWFSCPRLPSVNSQMLSMACRPASFAPAPPAKSRGQGRGMVFLQTLVLPATGYSQAPWLRHSENVRCVSIDCQNPGDGR